jgi:hypothetical protein
LQYLCNSFFINSHAAKLPNLSTLSETDTLEYIYQSFKSMDMFFSVLCLVHVNGVECATWWVITNVHTHARAHTTISGVWRNDI